MSFFDTLLGRQKAPPAQPWHTRAAQVGGGNAPAGTGTTVHTPAPVPPPAVPGVAAGRSRANAPAVDATANNKRSYADPGGKLSL